MITGRILSMLLGVLTGVLSLIPSIPVPSWLSASGPIGTVFQDAGLMGVWFPIQIGSTILVAVLGIWAAAFVMKIGRVVVSLFTGGGGSAA